MVDDLDGVHEERAAFAALLADERKLRDFAAANRDLVADEADARAYVGELFEGFDDLLHGRVVPHDQVVAEFEGRYRQRPTAAE